MATQRDNPYGAFNFLVSLGTGDESSVIAGFSDVSGLGSEINYSEYRNGNESFNTVRKIANTFKQEDITLKRGLMGSDDLFQWLRAVREGGVDKRQVSITLLDEARQPVVTFRLFNAQPKKWVGPTLAAKGGGEVAMEEFHLVCEGVTME
ncbi:MAG: phage tail protein [Rhodocyclaceae bacterium]|nr:phage tail protein [Rhodocyclaceae bacterium]